MTHPRCTCYRGHHPAYQDDPCGYCEARQEEALIPESHVGESSPDRLITAIHNADLHPDVIIRIADCYAHVSVGNRTAARYSILAPLVVKAVMDQDEVLKERLIDELGGAS